MRHEILSVGPSNARTNSRGSYAKIEIRLWCRDLTSRARDGDFRANSSLTAGGLSRIFAKTSIRGWGRQRGGETVKL